MKPYTDAPYASMDVRPTKELHKTLVDLFRENPVNYVLETGTYLGAGSTTIFATALQEAGILPDKFLTFETCWKFWMTAKHNLKRFPFVTPILGRTIRLEDAKNFLANDPAFNHQENYPDVYIDPGVDYYEEVKGNETGEADWSGENLLYKNLNELKDTGLGFICLDSAGGVGWLEFYTLITTLDSRRYFLFLDDCEHIKHFRSMQYIRANKAQFEILLENNGWALIEHREVK